MKNTMTKRSKVISALAAMALFSVGPAARADETAAGTGTTVAAPVDMGQTQATTPAATGTATGVSGVNNYAAPVTPGAAAQTARDSQGGQMGGAIVGAAVTTGFAIVCSTNPHPHVKAWACPLAYAAGGATIAMAFAARGSGGSANTLSTSGTNGDGSTSTTAVNQGSTSITGSNNTSSTGSSASSSSIDSQMSQVEKQVAAVQKDLAKSGYKMSADGQSVTGPDGKKTNLSTFSSPQAMAAAGFSSSDIKAMEDTAAQATAKVQDKIKGISMAVEGGAGGGGAMGGPMGGGGGAGGYGAYGAGMAGAGANGKQPKVSGLSKKLGADNIGMASDDIFEMIHVRYQQHDTSNGFKKD